VTDDARSVRRSDFAVHRVLATRWRDEDAYGHLNNVVHYELFDTAVNGWLIEATGLDIRDLPAVGLVVESSCRYLAPIRFPDDVTAGLDVERLGSTSVVYRLGLFGGDSEGPAALGRFVHVYVDPATRRPAAIPDVIWTALRRIHSPS
jgi:acyl-CoA thioester hydrolase